MVQSISIKTLFRWNRNEIRRTRNRAPAAATAEQPISRLGNRNQQLSLQLVFGSHSRIVHIMLNAELGTQSHELLR